MKSSHSSSGDGTCGMVSASRSIQSVVAHLRGCRALDRSLPIAADARSRFASRLANASRGGAPPVLMQVTAASP
jgi:hypothetical protein